MKINLSARSMKMMPVSSIHFQKDIQFFYTAGTSVKYLGCFFIISTA